MPEDVNLTEILTSLDEGTRQETQILLESLRGPEIANLLEARA